jgi:hypothetical protein
LRDDDGFTLGNFIIAQAFYWGFSSRNSSYRCGTGIFHRASIVQTLIWG